MAETVQSLEGLASLKPAAPEAPKYEKKVDAQGRAYATGKRKNAVARVWIKPGSGKILINTKAVEVFFARPVLRMLIQQPLIQPIAAGNTMSPARCPVAAVGAGGCRAPRLPKALTYFEPDLRRALKQRRIPDARPARGRTQEVRSRKGPALLPVLETLTRIIQNVKGAPDGAPFSLHGRDHFNF